MKLNVLLLVFILAITLVFNIGVISTLMIELQISCNPDCSGTTSQYNTTVGCTESDDFCNRLPLYNYIHAFQTYISVQLFVDSNCQTPASVAMTVGLGECVVVGPMNYQLLNAP